MGDRYFISTSSVLRRRYRRAEGRGTDLDELKDRMTMQVVRIESLFNELEAREPI